MLIPLCTESQSLPSEKPISDLDTGFMYNMAKQGFMYALVHIVVYIDGHIYMYM